LVAYRLRFTSRYCINLHVIAQLSCWNTWFSFSFKNLSRRRSRVRVSSSPPTLKRVWRNPDPFFIADCS